MHSSRSCVDVRCAPPSQESHPGQPAAAAFLTARLRVAGHCECISDDGGSKKFPFDCEVSGEHVRETFSCAKVCVSNVPSPNPTARASLPRDPP